MALLELGDSSDVTLLLRPVFRMLATAPADAAGSAGSTDSADVLQRIRSLPLDARTISSLLFHLEACGEAEASEFLRAQIRSAAKKGDLERLKKLLESQRVREQVPDINCVNGDGDGFLHAAVEGGSEPAVATLLLHGADVNRPGRHGYTQLHIS